MGIAAPYIIKTAVRRSHVDAGKMRINGELVVEIPFQNLDLFIAAADHICRKEALGERGRTMGMGQVVLRLLHGQLGDVFHDIFSVSAQHFLGCDE